MTSSWRFQFMETYPTVRPYSDCNERKHRFTGMIPWVMFIFACSMEIIEISFVNVQTVVHTRVSVLPQQIESWQGNLANNLGIWKREIVKTKWLQNSTMILMNHSNPVLILPVRTQVVPLPDSPGQVKLLGKCIFKILNSASAILWTRQVKFVDSKVRGADMGPTWILSAPCGPHVGPMNLAIRDVWHITSGVPFSNMD